MHQSTRTVNVGLIGLGTVGGGVFQLIESHAEKYRRAYGIDLRIARACGLDEVARPRTRSHRGAIHHRLA